MIFIQKKSESHSKCLSWCHAFEKSVVMNTVPAAHKAQKFMAVVSVNLSERIKRFTYRRSWMHLTLLDEKRVNKGAQPLTYFLRIGKMHPNSWNFSI